MPRISRLGATLTLVALAGFAQPALAQSSPPSNTTESKLETVIVTGKRNPRDVPSKIVDVDAAKARETVNTVNTEDMLKYAPSILVRKRHYGDTQDPLATRTSGVGASARSLIYVDGILISSPIGNNNSSASPHFGIAAPEDVSNLEVLYGPFAAEYAGGSIGAVLNITTRMPNHLEIYADTLAAAQNFNLYDTHRTYDTGQLSAGIGDRNGEFSWRLSASHLDSTGQPLALVTLPQPAAPSSVGIPVTGGITGFSRAAVPITILGAGSLEHQVQDTDTVKLAYDLTNIGALSYTASVFHQTDDAVAQTFLRDGAADPVYSGSVNSGGFNYNISASGFSNTVYDWQQTHLAQAISFQSPTGENFTWEIIASDYAYLADNQRVPSLALPTAAAGGPGSITSMNGTGWYTLDAKGTWQGWPGHDVSFGLHRDQEDFSQIKYNTADWIAGTPTGIATDAKGRTTTDAGWVQDVWSFAPQFQATLGGRVEAWRAYDGFNFSATPPLNVNQPKLSTTDFSPKASLAWQSDPWILTASWGSAYRMPTVTELYQAITTGTQLTVPNPNLKPEHANSYELAAEHQTEDGHIRLSLFQEDVADALLSQSAPLLAGSATLFSFVQNVDRTRARGIELVADRNNVLTPGLELSGSLTYVDGRTVKDTAFAAAVGKFIPQLPRLRGELVATYRPDDSLAFTLAARYSDRAFGTIDNSDPVSQTFQGFGEYLVLDTRVHYRINDRWSAAAGVDNLNDDKYFLFHPFPQRSFVMEIHYAQ